MVFLHQTDDTLRLELKLTQSKCVVLTNYTKCHYQNQSYNYYTNNTNNIKKCENNVLYQKYVGHMGTTGSFTRINRVGGLWYTFYKVTNKGL